MAERALYTVQGIRNVLHYDALQKELEPYGSVKKLRETGGMYRPELDGNTWKLVEYAGNYCIVQGLGSVNPYSYPCRHVRASDLWCRRLCDVTEGDKWLPASEVEDCEALDIWLAHKSKARQRRKT